MEYVGKIVRHPDEKHRILWPARWCHKDQKKFFIVQDEYVKIFPYEKWKEIMVALPNDAEKLAWANKSTEVTLDKGKRLTLPKECTADVIEMNGLIDYIIISKSTG